MSSTKLLNGRRLRGIALMVPATAALATFCDYIHVYTGTLVYPSPFLFGQGPFVFPGFVGAFTTMAICYLLLVDRLPAGISRAHSAGRGGLRRMVDSFILFMLVYVLSGFGNESPMFLNGLFYGTWALRMALTEDKAFMLILSVILAVLGVLGEGLMSMGGLVAYVNPDFFGTPAWLGGLYVHGAFALRDGMSYLVLRGK